MRHSKCILKSSQRRASYGDSMVQNSRRYVDEGEVLYKSLALKDHDSIRIFCIKPQELDTELELVLHVVRVADVDGNYVALSYTWGETEESRGEMEQADIMVNKYRISVGLNLHRFLRRLQQERHIAYIWADAICIDQSSDFERNHQIRLMGKIYSMAERTCAWLGDTMHHVEEELKRWSVDMVPIRRIQDTERCIDELLANPYWQRTWIVQEILLAGRVTFYIGYESVISYLFILFYNAIFTALRDHDREDLSKLLANSTMNSLVTASRKQGPQDLRDLSKLLNLYGETQCRYYHDRVFGLLGLLNDSSDPLSAQITEQDPQRSLLLKNLVDYTVPLPQLYLNLMELYRDKPFFLQWHCHCGELFN